MSFSDKFLEIMNSNIRPKCEPKITVTGTDSKGNTQTIVWNAKDIQTLSFHRSIDPVGRELPIMELEWTEVYNGKFDKDNKPLKYENVMRYMAVTLEFHQSLSFFRTWKDVKTYTWKKLKSLAWRTLKTETEKEIVKMPMLFLSATPELSGKKIKWVAKDALSFLTEKQTQAFYGSGDWNIPRFNPIVYLLINARSSFYYSKELFDYYTRTIDYFNSLPKTDKLYNGVIFDEETNSTIKNYISPYNEYLDFDEDKIIKKSFNATLPTKIDVEIPLTLQYGSPEFEFCAGLSNYTYKQYVLTLQSANAYTKSPDKSTRLGTANGNTYYKLEYNYDNYGTAENVIQDIKRGIKIDTSQNATISITPISYEGISQNVSTATFLQGSKQGELYDEDNKLNSRAETDMRERFDLLVKWFSNDNHIVKNTTPAMFNWKLGEFADCETLAYDGENHYKAPAMLIEYTMEYSGAIKQSNIAHEIARQKSVDIGDLE